MTETLAVPKSTTDPKRALWMWGAPLGALCYLVARGHLAPVDQQVASWVAPIRSSGLDGWMQTLTFFGSSTWTTLALVGLGLLAWRRGGVGLVLLLLGAFLVGSAMEVALRLSVPQWRPDSLNVPASMDPLTRFELAGFPSGHGFRSAFVFGWLARQLKDTWLAQPGRMACLLVIGLVGFSRLYLNRHWASDVIGSWLVVLVALSLARCWEVKSSRL